MSRQSDKTLAAVERLIAEAVSAHEAVAANLGLNATDLRCALLVAAEPGMTPTRLAELAGLTTGAITGVVDRLEQEGVVQRVPDPDDRRRLTLAIVPARLADLRQGLADLAERVPGLVRGWEEAGGDAAALLATLADAIGDEAARLRVAAHGGLIGQTYRCPRGSLDHGRLRFVSGAPRLSLAGAALGQQVRMVAETTATRLLLAAGADDAELVRADFDGPVPAVRQSAGTVTIRYRRRLLDMRSRLATVSLGPGVAWSVEVEGGVTDLDADLRKVRIQELEVRGGANHLRLRLPEPRGVVPIEIGGGAGEITIERAAAAARLHVRGGASRLRFDGHRLDSTGDVDLTSDGYRDATDRFEINVRGGVSDLRVS